jgi:hypothetical protein
MVLIIMICPWKVRFSKEVFLDKIIVVETFDEVTEDFASEIQ